MSERDLWNVFCGIIGIGADLATPTDLLVGQLLHMEDEDWHTLLVISKNQGLCAICIDGLIKIRSEYPIVSIPESLYLRWCGEVMLVEQDYQRKSEALSDFLSAMSQASIPVLVMKGFSVSKYYPNPSHREFSDIDVYLGDKYSDGDDIAKQQGWSLRRSYYRHSKIEMGGVTVENHSVLSERGTKSYRQLECLLQNMAKELLTKNNGGGSVSPSPQFNSLFLNWHMSSHFLFEKTSIRQILDLALFLKHEGHQLDQEMYRMNKSQFTFGRLSDICVAIALKKFGMSTSCLPGPIVNDACSVDNNLVERVFRDTMESDKNDKSVGVWKHRIRLVKRSLANGWKYSEVLGLGRFQFLIIRIAAVFTD